MYFDKQCSHSQIRCHTVSYTISYLTFLLLFTFVLLLSRHLGLQQVVVPWDPGREDVSPIQTQVNSLGGRGSLRGKNIRGFFTMIRPPICRIDPNPQSTMTSTDPVGRRVVDLYDSGYPYTPGTTVPFSGGRCREHHCLSSWGKKVNRVTDRTGLTRGPRRECSKTGDVF